MQVPNFFSFSIITRDIHLFIWTLLHGRSLAADIHGFLDGIRCINFFIGLEYDNAFGSRDNFMRRLLYVQVYLGRVQLALKRGVLSCLELPASLQAGILPSMKEEDRPA